MNTVIIQFPLDDLEVSQLKKEFPRLEFIHFPKAAFADIPPGIWKKGDIFFGERLTEKNLENAIDLRWIHAPSPFLQRLCLKKIEERGNILITNTSETNLSQIGEFVLSVVLSYAKNLFHWKTADQFPELLWDCKWRNSMWSVKEKIFLQIGLCQEGLSIARQANLMGMNVWGVDRLPSIRPHCQKNFSLEALDTLLPQADVVSLTIPHGLDPINCKMGKKELTLMKVDSILCILGTTQHIDEEVLYNQARVGKFRGILLDAYYQQAVTPNSKLWSIPQLLLTPGVASRPKMPDREAFRVFRINLRQYLNGNYSNMLNLVEAPIAHLNS